MKPSIGRIVHYTSHGSADGEYPMTCRAAIITEVAGDSPRNVGLCVLNPEGMFFKDIQSGGSWEHSMSSCDQIEVMRNGAGGTWHWPEQVR